MLSMCVVLFGALTSSVIPFQSCLDAAPDACGIDLKDKNWGCGSSASSPLCLKQVGCLADKVSSCLAKGVHSLNLEEVSPTLANTVKAVDTTKDCLGNVKSRCTRFSSVARDICEIDEVYQCVQQSGVVKTATSGRLALPHLPTVAEVEEKKTCLDETMKWCKPGNSPCPSGSAASCVWDCLVTQTSKCLGVSIKLPGALAASGDLVSCSAKIGAACSKYDGEHNKVCLATELYHCVQKSGIVKVATSGKVSLPSMPYLSYLPSLPTFSEIGDKLRCLDAVSKYCTRGYYYWGPCSGSFGYCNMKCLVTYTDKCLGLADVIVKVAPKVLPTDAFDTVKAVVDTTKCIEDLGRTCSRFTTATRDLCLADEMYRCVQVSGVVELVTSGKVILPHIPSAAEIDQKKTCVRQTIDFCKSGTAPCPSGSETECKWDCLVTYTNKCLGFTALPTDAATKDCVAQVAPKCVRQNGAEHTACEIDEVYQCVQQSGVVKTATAGRLALPHLPTYEELDQKKTCVQDAVKACTQGRTPCSGVSTEGCVEQWNCILPSTNKCLGFTAIPKSALLPFGTGKSVDEAKACLEQVESECTGSSNHLCYVDQAYQCVQVAGVVKTATSGDVALPQLPTYADLEHNATCIEDAAKACRKSTTCSIASADGCSDQWKCLVSSTNKCLGFTALPNWVLPPSVVAAAKSIDQVKDCLHSLEMKCSSMPSAQRSICEIDESYQCVQGAGVVNAATSGKLSLPHLPTYADLEHNATCLEDAAKTCNKATTCSLASSQGCVDKWNCLVSSTNKCLGFAALPTNILPSNVVATANSVNSAKDCLSNIGAKCSSHASGARNFCEINEAYQCIQGAKVVNTATSGVLTLPHLPTVAEIESKLTCLKNTATSCRQTHAACNWDSANVCVEYSDCLSSGSNKCLGTTLLPEVPAAVSETAKAADAAVACMRQVGSKCSGHQLATLTLCQIDESYQCIQVAGVVKTATSGRLSLPHLPTYEEMEKKTTCLKDVVQTCTKSSAPCSGVTAEGCVQQWNCIVSSANKCLGATVLPQLPATVVATAKTVDQAKTCLNQLGSKCSGQQSTLRTLCEIDEVYQCIEGAGVVNAATSGKLTLPNVPSYEEMKQKTTCLKDAAKTCTKSETCSGASTVGCVTQWNCLVSSANKCLGTTVLPEMPATVVATAKAVDQAKTCLDKVGSRCSVYQPLTLALCEMDEAYQCIQGAGVVNTATSGVLTLPHLPNVAEVEEKKACIEKAAKTCTKNSTPCSGVSAEGCVEQLECLVSSTNKCLGTTVIPQVPAFVAPTAKAVEAAVPCMEQVGSKCTGLPSAKRTLCEIDESYQCIQGAKIVNAATSGKLTLPHLPTYVELEEKKACIEKAAKTCTKSSTPCSGVSAEGCVDQLECLVSSTNKCLGATVIPEMPAVVSATAKTVDQAMACLDQVGSKCSGKQSTERTLCEIDESYQCVQGAEVVKTATSGKVTLPLLPTYAEMEHNATCLQHEVKACTNDDVPCTGNSTQCLEEVQCGMRAFNKCWGKKVLPNTLSLEKLYTRKDCAKPLGDSCGYNTDGTTAPETVSRVLCGLTTMVQCITGEKDIMNIVMGDMETCMEANTLTQACGMHGNIDQWPCYRALTNADVSLSHCTDMFTCATRNTVQCTSSVLRSVSTTPSRNKPNSPPVVPSSPPDDEVKMGLGIYLAIAGGGVALVAMLAVVLFVRRSRNTPKFSGNGVTTGDDVKDDRQIQLLLLGEEGNPVESPEKTEVAADEDDIALLF